MEKKHTVPANLPANAIGFIAPHLRDGGRLALYRADGSASNTYPSGMDLVAIKNAFDFGIFTLTIEGFLVA